MKNLNRKLINVTIKETKVKMFLLKNKLNIISNPYIYKKKSEKFIKS